MRGNFISSALGASPSLSKSLIGVIFDRPLALRREDRSSLVVRLLEDRDGFDLDEEPRVYER
jgi:hypothetical protein